MKFAFSSNAFRKYSLVDTIRILSEIGYEGIEILADVPHAYPPALTEDQIGKIQRELELHGMVISNINAFMLHAEGDTWHPSWIEQDRALRERRIQHTINCIDLAARLGARTLSTEPGGPLDQMAHDKALAFFIEGLKRVENRARDRGVRILIEPEPGLLVENSVQFRRLFDQLNPEVFGLNFDVGHFFCVGEDPVGLIREMGDLIDHVHIEDIAASREHYHLMLGAGAIDIPAVLDAIAETGYRNFVTVELYPYEDRPAEAAEEAFAYLQKWMGRGR